MFELTKDKNHKSSSYQYFINDIYINRVVQKGDPENSNKFQNFVERNNEFFNKKKLRLNQKIQIISAAANSEVYSIPNKKVFDKAELRNPQEFYENQKSFVVKKQQNLDVQRNEALKKSRIAEHGHIPEINQNSRILVGNKKKTAGEKAEEVFVRLHNQRNRRHKQQIFDELDSNDFNNINIGSDIGSKGKDNINKKAKSQQRQSMLNSSWKMPKLKGVKKPEQELQGYSSKLHDDAKKWLERNDERVKKVYGKATPDMKSVKTKLLNVKRFLENYENALQKISAAPKKIYQKNTNIKNIDNKENKYEQETNKLDFADYCDLLFILGFTKDAYEALKIHFHTEFEEVEKENSIQNNNNKNKSNNNNDKAKKYLKTLNGKMLNADKKQKLLKKQMQKEAKLLRDSWEILLSNNANKQNEIFKLEAVEPKEVLMFLYIVQGFLKGDIDKLSDEEENEMQQIKINSLYSEFNKAEKNLIKEKNEFEATKRNLHQYGKSLQMDLKMKGDLLNISLDKDEKNSEEGQEANRFRRVKSKDNHYKAVKRSGEGN